jgi:hypothetical protein
MLDEIKSLIKNQTWIEVTRTKEMNVVGSKWVFKLKRGVDGNITRHKARLVAKGYTQVYGIDYRETFAPVLKYKSLRIILALSATSTINIEQLDVKTAFLNANVEEDIYVEVPEGMKLIVGEDKVLKLQKALYGIKQAPREWNANIDAYLRSLGFQSCQKDPCLYIKQSRTQHTTIIGLFVDDIVGAFNESDTNEWNEVKKKLSEKYELTDMGAIQYVLGMKVKKEKDGTVCINQQVYMQKKLEEFNMSECASVLTPEVTAQKAKATDGECDANLYRRIIGSLIYTSTSTRPDIEHAVNVTSRHMQTPTHNDMMNAKRILRYLRGTTQLGLKYEGGEGMNDSVVITAYCDADWAGDKTDRRSTTGYCVFINNNLVSWNTKKQTTVALSTAEAELMSVCECVKEVKWIYQLLIEMGTKTQTPVVIHEDNQSTIKISENDAHHDRTKHIDIRHHFVRDEIKSKIIKMQWVRTNEQVADILTKPLTSPTFILLRNKLMKTCEKERETMLRKRSATEENK